MNAVQFSHALGKVNDKYIIEAITYERKKKSGWLKWGAMAACICLCVVGAISIFYPKGGSQDSNVLAIAALEFRSCTNRLKPF